MGPEGGGSLPAFGVLWPPVPVVEAGVSPVEGCREIGAKSAARAFSGLGMFLTAFDCDEGLGSEPVLISPLFAPKPGLVVADWAWPGATIGGQVKAAAMPAAITR